MDGLSLFGIEDERQRKFTVRGLMLGAAAGAFYLVFKSKRTPKFGKVAVRSLLGAGIGAGTGYAASRLTKAPSA